MKAFIEALNHIDSQLWAGFMLCAGIGVFFACALLHIPGGSIPEDLIVAAIAMLRVGPKSETTINAPSARTQQVSTGANPQPQPEETQ